MLVLALALFTQSPKLDLEMAESTRIDDRAVGMLGGGTHRYGGLLVSDDGKAVFALDGTTILRLRLGQRGADHLGVYLRKSDKEPKLYTSSQQYNLIQAGASKDDWEDVAPEAIVRAENEDSLTLVFSSEDLTRSAVGTVRWEPKEEYANLYTAAPGLRIIDGWPDATSNDVLLYLQHNDREKPSPGYTMMGGGPAPKSSPGRQVLAFSKNANKSVAYRFAESGFAHGVSVDPIAGDGKSVEAGMPSRTEFAAVTWIHPGKLVAFCDLKGVDPEAAERREQAGIYVWDDSGARWAKVSPCALEGWSSTGKHLLLRDMFLRRSWIVTLK